MKLFTRDSFEDLVMRGFSRKEIETVLGVPFSGNNEYYKQLAIIKSQPIFKNQKQYKLEFVKQNYSKAEITNYFKALDSSKLSKDGYLHFGIKRGNGSNMVTSKDIFDYLGLELIFKELMMLYRKKTSQKKYGTDFPQSSEIVKNKTKTTLLQKYGVEAPMLNSEIKQKAINASNEKYGTDYPVQSKYVQDKIKTSNLDKYGVTSTLQLLEVREKQKSTMLERYGVENSFLSPDLREKGSQTIKDTYGVNNVFESKEIKDKIKQTNLKKYSVENQMQRQEIKDKVKLTNQEQYGVDCVLQSKEIREKTTETLIEKYGYPNAMQAPEIKEKSRKTLKEHYGVDFPMQSPDIVEVYKSNSLKKYGVEWPSQSETVKNTIRENNIEKYGVEWPMQSDMMKEYFSDIYGSDNPMKALHPKQGETLTPKEKITKTKQENNTFNTSKPEDDIYKLLKGIFPDTKRNYSNDPRYPFACDFYVPSEDLFVELNFHWTHGKHEFNPNDKNDLDTLSKWREKAKKGSKFYEVAINVWTNRDPQKFVTARKNGLKYLVFWTEKEAKSWIYSLSKAPQN